MGSKHIKKIKLFKRLLLLTAFLGISFITSSCFVDYGLNSSNLDLVYTNHDTLYNFGTVQRFSVADSIIHFGSGDEISRAYDAQIIDRVVSKLEGLGWTRVYDSTANVVLFFGASSSTWEVYNYYDPYSYYGWYGGYGYGSGWGWYYPYYGYGYSTSTTYTTGTLAYWLTDPSKANSSNKTIPVEWIALINGLLSGTSSSTRINTGIDQSFSQSPYLRGQ